MCLPDCCPRSTLRRLEDGGPYLFEGEGSMTQVEQPEQVQTDDERRQPPIGYKQDLQRAWSGFSNFAISFTIISGLAGCFTTYGQAWDMRRPIAMWRDW